MQWLIHVLAQSRDPFLYPRLGKVQYFRVELLYQGFSIVEHPLYPGPFNSRFIAVHDTESMISYIALRYGSVEFTYDQLL